MRPSGRKTGAAPGPDIAARRAGPAAAGAPGAEALAILAAHHHNRARMLDLQLIGDAEPAAIFARALAVRRQAETPDDDRRLGFEHLDRHVAQKGDAHFGAGNAVALATRAGAARHRVGDDDPPAAAQFGGRDIGHDQNARSSDRHLSGYRAGQRPEYQIVHPHRGREAHAAGRREAGVDDRGLRQNQIDAAQDAGIDMDRFGFGHDVVHQRHRQERVVVHAARRQVQGGAHLRVRAVVVELDRAVAA